jgi:hypothetical protein
METLETIKLDNIGKKFQETILEIYNQYGQTTENALMIASCLTVFAKDFYKACLGEENTKEIFYAISKNLEDPT